MDPSGLLDALVAVAVYPGGLFLGVAWLVLRAVTGSPLRPGPARARDVVVLVATAGAVAQLPLPGSPLLGFPGIGGAALDLVPVVLLFAVAVDAGGAPRDTAVAAAVAGGAALALAAARHSLDLGSVVTAAGAPATAGRALLAASLALAAASGCARRRLSPVSAAGLALAAAATVVGAATTTAPVIAGAAACLGMVAVIGGLGRVVPRSLERSLAVASVLAAVSAAVLLLSATAG